MSEFRAGLSCVACAAALILLGGCGGDGSSSGSDPVASPSSVGIHGAVQKGPFVVDSVVFVNALDSDGRPTNPTWSTTIEDSIGSFSFAALDEGTYQIAATGYYFNETTGELSSRRLALRAIYDVRADSEQTANVNVMTHLISERVLELLADGTMDAPDAIVQAESELLRAFYAAIPVLDVGPFSALSVYSMNTPPGDLTGGDAYLLALSTALYRYAENRARMIAPGTVGGTNTTGTAPDNEGPNRELSLILDLVAADLADDGELQRPGFLEELVGAMRSLRPEVIAEHLWNRSLIDYPGGLEVPDASEFLDLCAGSFDCPWTTGARLPDGASALGAAAYGGQIYVFGSAFPIPTSPGGSTNVHVYDPNMNAWAARSAMPVEATSLAVHTVGDKIYVLPSYGPLAFRNEVLEYDPTTDEWVEKSPRPTYRYEVVSAVVGGKIYQIAGMGTIDDGPWESGKPWERKDYVEIYDPVEDRWTVGARAPAAVESAAGCVFGDEIYVFGGVVDSNELGRSSVAERSVYAYSTTSDSWSAKPEMPEARGTHRCVSVADEFFLLGGRDSLGRILDNVDQYDPLTDSWGLSTYLPTPRAWLSAAVVDGLVVTFGGYSGSGYLDVVEVLDPLLLPQPGDPVGGVGSGVRGPFIALPELRLALPGN